MSEVFDSCIEQESTGENRIIPTTAGSGIDDAKGTMVGTEKFAIPDEGEEELLSENELDMDAEMGLRIKKPDRYEYIQGCFANPFTAHMLCCKPNPEGMDELLFYVDKKLCGKISQELRQVHFVLCRSCSSGRFFLWAIKVSNTDWYRSLKVLFRKPKEFFKENAVRIRSDREANRYQLSTRPEPEVANWPTKPMGELIAEAIGQDNIITSPEHPVYKEITSGTELK